MSISDFQADSVPNGQMIYMYAYMIRHNIIFKHKFTKSFKKYLFMIEWGS